MTDHIGDGAAPDPEPVDHYEVATIVVGMVLWVIALVVLVVFFRHDLQRHHTTWWYWACGCGVLFGLYGLRTVIRRRG